MNKSATSMNWDSIPVETIALVARERVTETRLRSMATIEVVQEIHNLEDKLEASEIELDDAIIAFDEISALADQLSASLAALKETT